MYNNLRTREEVIKLIKEYNPDTTFEVVTKESDGEKRYMVKSKYGLYICSDITKHASIAYFMEGEYVYLTIFLKREI